MKVKYMSEANSKMWDKIKSVVDGYEGDNAKELFAKLEPILKRPQVITTDMDSISGMMVGRLIRIDAERSKKERVCLIVDFR